MAPLKRREVIGMVGGALAAWPLAAGAQQGERVRRVGVLMNTSADDAEAQGHVAAFREALQQLGWIEGRNIRLETRWGAASAERYRRYAAELIALAPDVILAAGGPVVAAIQTVSRTVPIVFSQAIDPIGAGTVASLAKPGATSLASCSLNTGLVENGRSCSRRSRPE